MVDVFPPEFRLDELLTVQADHELLDVFMGAQRHMRHLMDENRALQQGTVRLVRKTEVSIVCKRPNPFAAAAFKLVIACGAT